MAMHAHGAHVTSGRVETVFLLSGDGWADLLPRECLEHGSTAVKQQALRYGLMLGTGLHAHPLAAPW
jgi:hypothetical protein